MGLVIRQSAITSVISYAGIIIGYVNLLYLFPRYLAPDQVGLLRTIQDAAILFTPFAQFGIAQSIVRYYPQFAKDKKQSGSFLTLMLLLSLAGFFLFFLFFTLFRTTITSYFEVHASEFLAYTNLTLWLTLILLVTSVLEAFSRSLLKTVVPALLREVVVRLLFTVLVTAYFMGYLTYDEFIVSSVGAYLFCLVILVIYLWSSNELNLSFDFSHLKASPPARMISYTLLGFAGMAGMIIIGKMDSLMVSGMIGLSANAVYTTAFYMATVIEIPKRALSQLAMPLISRSFERNDMQEIQTLYQRTAIHQFIIGSILLLGVIANLPNIFSLMPRSEIYQAGYYVVLIVGLGKLVDMLFGPSSEIIVLSKYYAFNIVLILLLAGMTIAMNILLIPRYGIEGAAYGAALSLILFNVIKYFFIRSKLGMQPFTGAFLKVLAIAALTFGVHLILPKMSGVYVDLIIRSAAMTLVYGGLIWWTDVTPEGNRLVMEVMQKLRRK